MKGQARLALIKDSKAKLAETRKILNDKSEKLEKIHGEYE